MGGAVAICIKGTLMQATMTSDNFTGLAGTPKNEKLIIIFRIAYNLPYTRVVQGGSLAQFTDEKNNESRVTDIDISFCRITKISTLLFCSYATNSV